MALVCIDASFPSDVPHLHTSVQGSRCKEFAKRMEVHTKTAGTVAGQRPDHYTDRRTFPKQQEQSIDVL